MEEFLTPQRHNASGHYHDPYTAAGARSIMRRFRDDVIYMLDCMNANRLTFKEGKTMLSQSPLKDKVHVAAAMKTLNLVREQPTKNGSCALVLTDHAVKQLENLKRYL